jgi:hypothetical protein
MTNLSGISLTCVAGDAGAPTTVGAPVIGANRAKAIVPTNLTPDFIASMIAPGICRVQQHDTHLIPTRLLSNEISDHEYATAAMLQRLDFFVEWAAGNVAQSL